VSDWIRVKRVTYHEHRKPGKPPSLRVSYLVGIGSQYSEWVCFEHDGPAAKKAQNWWFVRARSAAGVEPRSVQEALQRLHELSAATFIKVRFNGQHWNVVDCRFDASVETKAA
jgi:DNA repair protein RadD